MNSLSWFIYLIQVTDSLREVAIATSVLLGILAILVLIFIAVSAAQGEGEYTDGAKRIVKRYIVPVAIGLGLIIVFVPNRQTLLLIAGSEIGERVMKSEDVKGVIDPSMDLLKAWIKAETERLTNKPKEAK